MAILGYALLAVAIFVTDFSIKNYIENHKKEGDCDSACGGKLLIRRYHNKGAFLDFGHKKSGIVRAVSLALTLFLTVLFLAVFSFKGNSFLKAGLAVLLGGAYSNTYDRLRRKYVMDYISFPVQNRKIRNIVFNISDFAIMIGAVLILIGEIK